MTTDNSTQDATPGEGTDIPAAEPAVEPAAANVAEPAAEAGSDAGGCPCAELAPEAIDACTEVLFKGERRGYYVNATGLPVEEGTYVIVEAEKGNDLGVVSAAGATALFKSRQRTRPCADPLRRVLRLAEESEVRVIAYHREQERTAFEVCLEKIHMLNLPMKLVDVEFQFDRNRITFYFTADGRVDFRELVRELASEYRTRIELRQIGPRDEARRIGGFGVCGRELCCNAWLGAFEPISTDMAKLQNLSLNPFKLAGQCGRLKCCLSYELRLYEELLKKFPPLDYTFNTERGQARIEKLDIFQDAIYIHYRDSDAWERLTLEEAHALMEEKKEGGSDKPQKGRPQGPRDEGRKHEGRREEGRREEHKKGEGQSNEGRGSESGDNQQRGREARDGGKRNNQQRHREGRDGGNRGNQQRNKEGGDGEHRNQQQRNSQNRSNENRQQGNSQNRQQGNSQNRQQGNSQNRQQGNSQNRQQGNSQNRQPGNSQNRQPGDRNSENGKPPDGSNQHRGGEDTGEAR
jgi:cell fate regulator YaaT (PSP1 superfamily)